MKVELEFDKVYLISAASTSLILVLVLGIYSHNFLDDVEKKEGTSSKDRIVGSSGRIDNDIPAFGSMSSLTILIDAMRSNMSERDRNVVFRKLQRTGEIEKLKKGTMIEVRAIEDHVEYNDFTIYKIYSNGEEYYVPERFMDGI